MRRLWLIRHGRVVGDGRKRFLGRTDLAMSPAGEAEIAAVAARLAGEPLDLVVASDMRRSRRTADIVAARRRVPIRVVPELREIDMGAWENREQAQIARCEAAAWKARGADLAGYRPPEGESFADVALRVAPVLSALMAEPGLDTVAIAGHAGVDRVLLALALGLPLDRLFAFALPYGALARLDFDGEKASLAALEVPSAA